MKNREEEETFTRHAGTIHHPPLRRHKMSALHVNHRLLRGVGSKESTLNQLVGG